MEPNMILIIGMNAATGIVLTVAIGALLAIIKMLEGKLCKGWRLMIVTIVIAVGTVIAETLWELHVLEYPYHIFLRFSYAIIGMLGLWVLVKSVDDARREAAACMPQERR